ncbi:aminotransferase class V-fold PLP-dependent enzyme [Lapillicoccus sp.]|uniref:aminotransferase class V-fold PLP-dependent enzyme n=1 Tax=Lapillicoccus sp. TaxID=1909287 RepID=UPI0032668C22
MTAGPSVTPAARSAPMVRIEAGVIGADQVLDGPYGPRRVIYADYTASGRSLSFVEDYLRLMVLPTYANTHTEASGTGLQTTRLREEARDLIRKSIGAGDETAVIFCGSGATAAVDKLVGILNLRIPADLDADWSLSTHIPADQRPVVFVGPFEHHSNEIPWRETIADVVRIRADTHGHIDPAHLAEELRRYANRPLLIGSFSAASNVTGILSDTDSITILLHQHGALAFWDFAAAGPYVDIAMAGRRSPAERPNPEAGKDAVFLSPHKFIGGPETPGVLAIRRHLVANTVPVVPGGGTVTFVTPSEHAYVSDVERREEGGTPAIIGAIRAGLVFQLKDAVGVEAIRGREQQLLARALERWRTTPAIEVLGDSEADRLAIISFLVRAPSGLALHHNFVVTLLNDLFGIQARGGCSCAGPYGHQLLGIDAKHSRVYQRAADSGCEGLKPGWVRVNLNYFVADQVADHIIAAVDFIAQHGHQLLHDYRFDPATGLWRHRLDPGDPPIRLADIYYDDSGVMAYPPPAARAPAPTLKACLDLAHQIVATLPHRAPARITHPHPCLEDLPAGLLWFDLPPVCLTPAPQGETPTAPPPQPDPALPSRWLRLPRAADGATPVSPRNFSRP